MALRVILTTGGTGGHIFPALAVAEALKKRLPDVEILFVGGLYGREQELAEKAGLPFQGLPVRGVLGRGLKAVPAAWAMLLPARLSSSEPPRAHSSSSASSPARHRG